MGMWLRGLITAMILTGFATLLLTSSVHAAGEGYGNSSGDWIWHVQGLLKHAATSGQKWPAHRVTIERQIQEVGYYLQSAVLAIRTADFAVALMNAEAAIRLIERGVTKDYFRRSDVEPIMLIIKQQLPDLVRNESKRLRKERG